MMLHPAQAAEVYHRTQPPLGHAARPRQHAAPTGQALDQMSAVAAACCSTDHVARPPPARWQPVRAMQQALPEAAVVAQPGELGATGLSSATFSKHMWHAAGAIQQVVLLSSFLLGWSDVHLCFQEVTDRQEACLAGRHVAALEEARRAQRAAQQQHLHHHGHQVQLAGGGQARRPLQHVSQRRVCGGAPPARRWLRGGRESTRRDGESLGDECMQGESSWHL
jgi:hypothetical protein